MARYQENLISGWLAGTENPCSKGWQFLLKNPIRAWLIARAGNKCEKCGWSEVNQFTEKSPLQIHHLDGKASNNRPENLQVLCPNCHSLTENFGNRGKSCRTSRHSAIA